MILLIDNYDSFTYNLAQLLQSLGATVRVYRNDALTVKQALALGPSHIVLSPGPATPQQAGICLELLRETTVPTLGVCLGHQAIAVAFGGSIEHAPRPMHGFASNVVVDPERAQLGVFVGISQGFSAARYHSWVVASKTLPSCLRVTAWVRDEPELIMALEHREKPVVGLQFHPESVLTPEGPAIVRNFLL